MRQSDEELKGRRTQKKGVNIYPKSEHKGKRKRERNWKELMGGRTSDAPGQAEAGDEGARALPQRGEHHALRISEEQNELHNPLEGEVAAHHNQPRGERLVARRVPVRQSDGEARDDLRNPNTRQAAEIRSFQRGPHGRCCFQCHVTSHVGVALLSSKGRMRNSCRRKSPWLIFSHTSLPNREKERKTWKKT